MSKAHYFIYGVLVGVIMVLGVLLVTRQPDMAYAQSSGDTGAGMGVATGFGGSGQSGESWLWVLDPTTKHLALYATEQGKAIKAIGVRNITWDLQVPMQADSRQLADLEELRKAAEKAADKDRKKGGKDDDDKGKGGAGS